MTGDHRRTPPVTYESPRCQAPILNNFSHRISKNVSKEDTLRPSWPGDRNMLASTPSTEPEAEMREGFDTGPSRFPWSQSISAPSANAGVRGRAPFNKSLLRYPSFPGRSSSLCAPDCGLQSEESPIRHTIGRSILSSRVSQSQKRPFQGENDSALTRYWTKLPELTSARSNPFSV